MMSASVEEPLPGASVEECFLGVWRVVCVSPVRGGPFVVGDLSFGPALNDGVPGVLGGGDAVRESFLASPEGVLGQEPGGLEGLPDEGLGVSVTGQTELGGYGEVFLDEVVVEEGDARL